MGAERIPAKNALPGKALPTSMNYWTFRKNSKSAPLIVPEF
jgi:hypothetical protein